MTKIRRIDWDDIGDGKMEIKPIEFTSLISCRKIGNTAVKADCSHTCITPGFYDSVVLIAKDFNGTTFDLMAVNKDECRLYLGHWNDGVI